MQKKSKEKKASKPSFFYLYFLSLSRIYRSGRKSRENLGEQT